MSQTQRILWIDNAKGLILFFVLIFHAKFPWHSVQFVSSWFMPCFFLISGMLFKMQDNSIKETLIRRMRTLLVPYLGLSVLFMFLNPMNYQGDVWLQFRMNIWDILMGNSGFMTVSLWFVYVLFEVCCTTAVIYWIIQKQSRATQLGVLGMIMILCLTADAFCNGIMLPFKLSAYFSALFMYLLGYLLRSSVIPLQEKCTYHIAITTLIIFAIAIILFEVDRPANFILSEMHRIGLFLSGSFSLIGIVYVLTIGVRDNFICQSLRYLANNALCFLAVHMWGICMCIQCMPQYNPYIAATLGLTLSLVLMPLANRYTPWLVGKKR